MIPKKHYNTAMVNELLREEKHLEKTTSHKTPKEARLERKISSLTGKKYVGRR